MTFKIRRNVSTDPTSCTLHHTPPFGTCHSAP